MLALPGNLSRRPRVESAYAVGPEFDRVVPYEELDLRGRKPGKMTKLMSSALTDVRPGTRREPATDLDQAVIIGTALAAPTDPVLLVHAKMEHVLSVLDHHGAQGPLELHSLGAGSSDPSYELVGGVNA